MPITFLQIRMWFGAVLVLVIGGCVTHTEPQKVSVDELPLISELLSTPSSSMCTYVKIRAPHGSRVCVMGTFGSVKELTKSFPFINEELKVPGAYTLHSNIPGSLLKAVNVREPSDADDPFWMCNVSSLKYNRVFSVYVGYSLDSNYYYLEYRWQH